MRQLWTPVAESFGTSAAPGRGHHTTATATEITGLVAVVSVAAIVGAFAWAFREAVLALTDVVFGVSDPIVAIEGNPAIAVAVVTALAVIASVAVGRGVLRRRRRHERHEGLERLERYGLSAIGDAVAGRAPAPTVGTTMRRAAGTWIASGASLSIGRESAILETGGAVGWAAGRRWARPFAPALVAGGVSAGFAAAYHAPVAGALYVGEHLGGRRSVRHVAYATIAAIVGVAVVHALGSRPVLPSPSGDHLVIAVRAAVAFPPAIVGSLSFRVARERAVARDGARSARPGTSTTRPSIAFALTRPTMRADRSGSTDEGRASSRFAWMAALAVASIVLVPMTSGNGMEALHHASTRATLGVAFALAVGKLVATTAALGAGIPGGAFWASLAVPAGWALLAFSALDAWGWDLPGSAWDGMLAAMVVGIAIGMRAPLVATFAVAEMTGDLWLVPLFAAVAFVAAGSDRAIGHLGRVSKRDDVRDEDA